jgi:hypothetical protein
MISWWLDKGKAVTILNVEKVPPFSFFGSVIFTQSAE